MKSTITHFHLFCGVGGGALGFNRGEARFGKLVADFRCVGGIDSDASACRDFTRLVGTPATCLDLFSREQYERFYGHRPPPDWCEATVDDVRRAAGGQRPDIFFTSPPCKGFSGLLSSEKSRSPKYEALNELVLRGLLLALEAWSDEPPPLILLENVPRIQQRGRSLLERVQGLLRGYGYASRETVHDAGELGGLAQHRRRFLLVARHEQQVPSFLYEPSRRRVRPIGDVLSELPPPCGSPLNPLHRLPNLTAETWMRLALIPAGKDWRALRNMDLVKLALVRYGSHRGKLRVEDWAQPAHTVTGSDRVGSGALSVADARWNRGQQYGVLPMDQPSGAVTAQAAPGSGRFSVADPAAPREWFRNILRVTDYQQPSGTVTGACRPSAGAISVADPGWHKGVLGVLPLDQPIGTVPGRSSPTNGAFSIADTLKRGPRFNNVYRLVEWRDTSPCVTAGGSPTSGGLNVADPRAAWQNAGHYGVVSWGETAGAVTAAASHDNGRNNVADPRPLRLEELGEAPLIVSLDGTWHRPLTTLELAALQGFPTEGLTFDGRAMQRHREKIGNAVPPPAAQAIAGVMGQVLLMARSGQTFALSSTPVWVRPVALALTVDGEAVWTR
ncbi:MAG TPA: DNA cytosine methyltransferase [Thauera aminoaromatica]|nr:DNA cytosine methyltransferase [Thauera aminoaromatica]